MSLRIIYITGATACGKGTLGKRLAAEFGFYHISLGDVRRSYLASVNDGIPSLRDESIRNCIRNGEVIPQRLLDRYTPTPAVLHYYNHRARGLRSWTFELACTVLDEELANAQAGARRRGECARVIVDGHPLTGGELSIDLVERYAREFAGLTILIESPIHVARRRYIERGRLPGENVERFESRMELTARTLPVFVEFMGERGEVVCSQNGENMTINAAYNSLQRALRRSNAWRNLVREMG